MDDEYRMVYFDKYCSTCEYSKNKETDSPCDECLDEPTNLYSEKPVYYKPINETKTENK